MEKKYKTLKEFYPYYLKEHSNATSRKLHFVGTGLVILLILFTPFTGKFWLYWLILPTGYGFAWVGHFFFEKNKPATFQYPFFSLASDFIMFYDILTGKINEKIKNL